MKILAIDPMSTFATFDGKVCKTYSCDKNHKEYSFYSKMLDIIRFGNYDKVIIEDTYFPHANSQRILHGQLAILRVICHPFKTKIVTMAPTQMKLLFCGSGKATKEDIIAEAKKKGHNPKNDHEADAIGLYYSYKKRA